MNDREKMLDKWVDTLVAYAKQTIAESEIDALCSACDGDISERAAVVWIAEGKLKERKTK